MYNILKREQLALVELTAFVLSNRGIVKLLQEHSTIEEEIAILKDTCRSQLRNATLYVEIMILRELKYRNIMNTYLPFCPERFSITSRALRPLISQETVVIVDTNTTKTRKQISAIKSKFNGIMYRIPITQDVVKYNLFSKKTLKQVPLIKVISTRKDIFCG